MRDSEKVGIGVAGGNSEPVQPTKQADQSTPATSGENTQEQPSYYWDRYTSYSLRRSAFTEQFETYRVEIEGSFISTDNSRREAYIEKIYEEKHPCIAIGRAVIEFMERHRFGSHISDIQIYRLTQRVKRPRKRKQ